MEYILVDDSVEGVGGTAFTLEGLVEPVRDKVKQIPTASLSNSDVLGNLGAIWIFGNIHGLSVQSFDAVINAMSMVKFFKIEFDYGYCRYRGRIPHQILGGEPCNCGSSSDSKFYQDIYKLIVHRSLLNFYMSEEQMKFHIEDTGVSKEKCMVLSSCFDSRFYSLIEEVEQTPKNGKYAIIDGQGGWHSNAKGVGDSIDFAKKNHFDYDLLKTTSHEELIRSLAAYNGLIFLPIIHDTCPRITIEAKLLGLDLKINEKCQHTKETWWTGSRSQMIKYLKQRPAVLWDSIRALI